MGNIFSPPSPPPPEFPTYEPPPLYEYQPPVRERPFVWHDIQPVAHEPPTTGRQTNNKRPCRFYMSSRGCLKGRKCLFSHDPEVIRAAEAVQGYKNATQAASAADDWNRELRGTWAQFADGAVVAKLMVPTDFGAARLDNVPTSLSIVSMLAEVGIVVTPDQVRPIPRNDKTSATKTFSAIVKVEDPEFAQKLRTRLSTCENMPEYQAVQVVPIPVPMPQGSSMQRIDCRRVQCSWLRPCRTARLRFQDHNVANRVKKAYEDGAYSKILGPVGGRKAYIQAPKRVSNQANKRGAHDQVRNNTELLLEAIASFSMKNNDDETARTQGLVAAAATTAGRKQTEVVLVLNGLPATLESTDSILEAVVAHNEHNRPLAVELDKASYEADPEVDATVVMSMFTAIGPLESWNLAKGSFGRYERAYITYGDEAHAYKAVSALKNRPLSFGDDSSENKLCLKVEHLISASFRVPTRVYNAVQGQLNEERGNWNRQFIRLVINDPRGQLRVIKIEGKDRAVVARAKETASRILAGTVLRRGHGGEDAPALWSEAFRNANSREVAELTQMENNYGVVLQRDLRKSQLRVFGPSDAPIKRIALEVATLVAGVDSSRNGAECRSLPLNDRQLVWLFGGGRRQLEEEVGPGKVALGNSMTSRSPVLIIQGSASDLETASQLLETLPRLAGRHVDDGGGSSSRLKCLVCQNEVPEMHTLLSCGHAYCSDCFVEFCTYGARNGGILCIGNNSCCLRPVRLQEMQTHLTSAVLEDILSDALDTHVQQHPRELRNCPTPDCQQVYRVGSYTATTATTTNSSDMANKRHIFTCGSCLASTCTFCHSAHPDRPCADKKAADDAATLRAKMEQGLQDCPHCGVLCVKVDGCHHVQCLVCKVHFCWKCLAFFNESEACYSHMRKAHSDLYR